MSQAVRKRETEISFRRDIIRTGKRCFSYESILSSAAMILLTLGIGNISSRGLLSVLSGGLMAVGLILMVIFVLMQLRQPIPYLDLRLLRHKDLSVSVISSIVFFAIMKTAMLSHGSQREGKISNSVTYLISKGVELF